MQCEPGFTGRLSGEIAELAVVRPAHIRETRPERRIVGSAQRRKAGHAHEVDMVGDQHDVTRHVLRMDRAGGVGQDHGLHAQQLHDADRQRDVLQVVAFIEMGPPLLHKHRHALKLADQDPACMAKHSRLRPVRDVRALQNIGVLDGVGQITQPGAQHQAYARLMARVRPDVVSRCLKVFTGQKVFHG